MFDCRHSLVDDADAATIQPRQLDAVAQASAAPQHHRGAGAARRVSGPRPVHGTLDGAFNNAGIEGVTTNILKMSEAEFDRTIRIDLKGVWLCVKREIEQFVSQGLGGTIINTASVAGLVGARGGSAYCAAQHGVIALTKSVALEYARKKIRVRSLKPL